MPATMLFVKDDRAWLALEPHALFDLAQRLFEHVDAHGLGRRRIERYREQEFLAPRGAADRIGFMQRAHQIGRREATQIEQLDMLILFPAQKMSSQLLGTATL